MRTYFASTAAVLCVLGLAGNAAAIPDEQAPGQKGRREKALADLDKEVAKLVKLVTAVDTMSPCKPAASPAPAPARAAGKRPKLAVRGGAPFCPEKYQPIKTKLQALIGEVSSNSGSDARAGAVISFWPQFVVSFESRLEDLANMKVNHKSALTIGQQCKKTSDDVLALGNAALGEKTLDAFDEVQNEATKRKTDVTSWISTQSSMQSSMGQWERNTRLFEPTGPHDKAWKPVYKALHASSKRMLDQWNADWANATKLCAEPAKGEDHAELKKLEDKLYETLKKDLEADLEKWRESVKTMYRYDCDSMKKLYEYYCMVRDGDDEVTLDEFEADDGVDEVDDSVPVDGDSEDVQYLAQADEMAKEMKNKELDAWAELGAMRTRALVLGERRNGRIEVEAFKKWRDGLAAWAKTEIGAEEEAIQDVIDKGIYQGSRNPKIQLWKDFGIQQHKALEVQPQFQCTLADASFCRWRRKGACVRYTRPDCISVDQCKIWEFKPVNGKDRGERQVSRYKRTVEKHYNFALGLVRKDELGSFKIVGGQSMLTDLEANCMKGDKIALDKEVFAYPKCGADLEYKCSPKAK